MKDGGPAFPRGAPFGGQAQQGMSLRAWLAGQALAGMAHEEIKSTQTPGPYAGWVAAAAVRLADAVIAELEKGDGPDSP